MGSAEMQQVDKYSGGESTKTTARIHIGGNSMPQNGADTKSTANTVFIDLKTIAEMINVPTGSLIGSALKYEASVPSKLRSRNVQYSSTFSGLPANTNITALPILLDDLRSWGFFISEQAERECMSLFQTSFARR